MKKSFVQASTPHSPSITNLPKKNKRIEIAQSLLAELPERLSNLPKLLSRSSKLFPDLSNKSFNLSNDLLKEFPKTELHCHLEAALESFDLIYKIAEDNNCSQEDLKALMQFKALDGSVKWRIETPVIDGFNHFLNQYAQADTILQVNLFLDFAKWNSFTDNQLTKLSKLSTPEGEIQPPSTVPNTNDFKNFLEKDSFKEFLGKYASADATLRLNMLLDFSKRNHFTDKQLEKLSMVTEFTHFLAVYDQLSAVLQKPKDIEDLTYEYLHAQHNRGVIYQELTVAPILTPNLTFEEYIEAVSNAITNAQKEFGIEARILLVIVRHHEHWQRDVDKLLSYSNPKERFPYIVGGDIAGDEKNYPAEKFAESIKKLRACGYQWKAHVGEMTGPKRMKADIEALNLTRIGHGINAIKNLNFLRGLIRTGVHFEICMQSNTAFLSEEEIIVYFENIAQMLAEGPHINLNSDDPVFFGDIVNEYILAYILGFNLYQNTCNGIEASYASAEIKEKLRMKVDHWMKEHKEKEESGELQCWWDKINQPSATSASESDLEENTGFSPNP